MHADEFFWHDKWDTFSFDMGYLMDEIDKVAPGCNYWRCDAAGYNWRGDSGYTHIAKSEVDEEPLKLLRETLNDFGQCTIRLYWDKESPEFTISSSCHDVPMGATYEYKLVKLEESYEHNT
jgi:hypothetical protein